MPVQTDPYDFVNGTLADADQVDLRFKRLYDLQNPAAVGITADNTTDAFAKDVVEPAFSSYKPAGIVGGGLFSSSLGAGNWVLRAGPSPDANQAPLAVAVAPSAWAFYLDPADWTAGSRNVQCRIRASIIVNATTPGTSINVYLIAVTFGGAAGATPTIATITGSTLGVAAFAAPLASTSGKVDGADFAIPAAGYYCLIGQTGGAIAATSVCHVMAALHYHQT